MNKENMKTENIKSNQSAWWCITLFGKSKKPKNEFDATEFYEVKFHGTGDDALGHADTLECEVKFDVWEYVVKRIKKP